MTNKYIELVKKWLADKASVSSEELRANVDAASVAASASASAADDTAVDAALALYAARAAAGAGTYGAGHVADLVKRYEELTNGK